jgi:hypothetical protein
VLQFSFEQLSTELRELAYLNSGLEIAIVDGRTDKRQVFKFEGGIATYVADLNATKTPVSDVIAFTGHAHEVVLGDDRELLDDLERLRQPRSGLTVDDLGADEIAQCFRACAGDLDTMAVLLQVSRHALSRRLRALGLAG